MDLEIKAWIGNLGKYNEGDLVGEWVTFPIADGDLDTVLKRIGIGELRDPRDERYGRYEEWFVADYDSELPLASAYGEYPDLEELNDLGETVAAMDNTERTVLKAACDVVSLEDALTKVRDGDYVVWSGCEDMGDVAYRYLHETSDPETCKFLDSELGCYFDYGALGRDLDIEGTFIELGDDVVELID